MKIVSSSASAANGTATRKRCPVAVPKAFSKIDLNGSSRVRRSGMPPVLCCAAIPRRRRLSATCVATWWASTAPSAETPIEPPIERKNVTTELAAPRSDCATLFCTASTRFCIEAPSPRPSTLIDAPTYSRLVVASMRESSSRPTTTSVMPPTRNFFHRPYFVISRPLTMLETSSPPTMATDIRPASVGLMPRASWKYWLR